MANEYTRIDGWHVHPTNIDTSGMQARYPWAELAPGGLVCIFETSLAARAKLSSAAANAGKRLGRKFSTGRLDDETGAHAGWWAARVDGCTILPRPKTNRDLYLEQEATDRLLAKKAREASRRNKATRHRIGKVLPLGSVEAERYGDPLPAPGPAIDYATADLSDWQTPVPVAGEATEGEAF